MADWKICVICHHEYSLNTGHHWHKDACSPICAELRSKRNKSGTGRAGQRSRFTQAKHLHKMNGIEWVKLYGKAKS